jgi:hypothetical protein
LYTSEKTKKSLDGGKKDKKDEKLGKRTKRKKKRSNLGS